MRQENENTHILRNSKYKEKIKKVYRLYHTKLKGRAKYEPRL